MNKSFNTLLVQPSNTFKFAIEQLEVSSTLDEKIVKIDKLNNLVETALEDFTSLSKIHKVLKYEQNNTALESASLFVESICYRQGMVFKPRYFSMENNSSSRQIAIEGVGSFLKTIWDAIISAIKKMIDWIANLFGDSNTGDGASGSLPEHLNKKLQQTEEIISTVQETIKNNPDTAELVKKEVNNKTGAGPQYLNQYTNLIKKLVRTADYKSSINETVTDAEIFTNNISNLPVNLKKLKIADVINAANSDESADNRKKVNEVFTEFAEAFKDFKNFKEKEIGSVFSSIFNNVSIGENFSLDINRREYKHQEPTETDLINFMNEVSKDMFSLIIQNNKKLVDSLKDNGVDYIKTLRDLSKEIDLKLNDISKDPSTEHEIRIKRVLNNTSVMLTSSIRLLTLCSKEVTEITNIVHLSAALYSKIAKHYS